MGTTDLPTAAELGGQLTRLQSIMMAEPLRSQPEVEELLEVARRIGARAQEAQALIMLAACAFFQARYSDMLQLAEAALGICREVRLPLQETRALNSMGLAYQRMGQLEQAMVYLLDSLRLSNELLDQEGSCRALSNIAMIYVALGDYEVATSLHEQALEKARACGSSVQISDTLGSLLEDHFKLRQLGPAFDLADEAVAFPRERGLVRYECAARTTLSRLLLHLGRARMALISAETALPIAIRAEDPEAQVGLLLAAGQAHLMLRDLPRAEAALQESLQLSRDLDYRDQEWQAHEALARLYEAQGNTVLARQHFALFTEGRQAIYAEEATRRAQALARQAQVDWSGRSAQQFYPWSGELNALMQNLRQAKSELAMISAFDLLTGVANRSHFQMRAQRRLELLVDGEFLGFVFIGLDYMKALNERFGHAVGDSVLVEVARRIQAMLRPGDLVGRLGSDEFVVMLNYLGQESDLEPVMTRLLDGLREPFELRGQLVRLTASLGGATYPRDARTLEELFRDTDLALNQAKARGRNQALRFDSQMRYQERRRANLLYDLQNAVPQRQLRLYYQAQYSVPARQLTGVEALVRWQHPELGLVPPDQFIRLAEENRLIIEIGQWVLHEACRQAQEWDFGGRGLKMSVNVSALQFEQPDFVAVVGAALRAHGLQGPELILELTESMVHTDERRASLTVSELQALGVKLALDDFGAGFSSLGSLQKLHLDYLKLDRVFMEDLSRHATQFSRAKLLMDMMINLAHNMNMVVVAEGIEHEEQLDVLTELGCDQVQGFLLARPVPAAEMEKGLG